MEDLLSNLSKEALNYKFSTVHKAAMDAYAFLECQQCGARDSPHVLRSKCFQVIKLALETKRNKLITLAINGIYKMIRDDRFQSNFEPEDDSLWFPSQLLHAFSSIQTQADDAQVDMLKVLLYVACSTYWTVNGRIIIQILTMCSEVYENGSLAIRSASQAASSQILCAFCHFLDEECQEVDSNKTSNSAGILCFNEAIPILQFICCKVDETQSGGRCGQSVVFFLECLHTLTSSLPQKIHLNRHFTAFLWQKLCPVLIAFLGSPRVDKKFISREDRQIGESGETGRGSGGLATAPGFDSYQAKTVYSIGNQLVRLVGCVGSHRPVLESVYHRMLLYPPPEHRLEALKALKEILRSVNRLVDFAGPILIEDDKQQFCQQSDMALTRLVMDSIEESSHCGQLEILHACVSCISSLLSTLTELSSGKGINEKYVEKINTMFPTLADADYSGPLTYDSSSRLPNVYREILQYKLASDNISSVSRSSSGHSSGDTEGPEEGLNDSDVEEPCSETERKKQEKETERLNKVRRASITESMTKSSDTKVVKSLDLERENARQFVKTLLSFLPSLFQLRSTLQVDEALQEFSSKYCQGVIDNGIITEQATIMNADGIYLAIYTVLRFNLKLINIGYYQTECENLPMTEDQFVEEVHGSGILVYLSASWLSELYQQVLVTNFLKHAGYDPNTTDEYLPLINLLTDVDGNLSRNGSHVLSDYQRLERACIRPELTPEIEAGRKMSRRILTCCWDSILDVLSTTLQYSAGHSSSSRIKLLRKNKNNEFYLKNCFSDSLESLQKAAELTNVLGLQSRCGHVFSLIVNAACPDTTNNDKISSPLMFLENNHKLHVSQALSMDVVLSCGLELGSHSPDSWKHIFKCTSYVCHLEQKLFKQTNESVLRKFTLAKKNTPTDAATSASISTTEGLKLTLNSNENVDDEVMDVYSFLATSPSPVISSNEQTISEIITASKADSNGGILSNEVASHVICLLSQKIDRLFEEAALKLNLEALMGFVKSLCAVSHQQLFSRVSTSEMLNKHWWKLRNIGKISFNDESDHSLFLTRINQVMLKCIRSGRPLLHVMKIWSLVGPHYIEAACNKEQAISKISVICIHDTITALLNEQVELAHFHFNEALFKPFEILLCLELCDSDIQDQIVSCICEFVEGNRADIRSGWRSLFGGLRVISSVHLASLNNVFKVFLDTDNTLVFSNAAVDFIVCLLRHVKGTDEANALEDSKDDEKGLALAAAALKYLHQCCGILGSMFNMPACPVFHTAHNVQINLSKIDPEVPDKTIVYFGDDKPNDVQNEDIYTPLSLSGLTETSLSQIDKPSGVLRVWASMIESLSFTCMVAIGKYQSQALDMLFVIVQDLRNIPGIEFALFCVNNILLPFMQHWLRKIPTGPTTDSTDQMTLVNFKQSCGTLTDLIVGYIQYLAEKSDIDKGTLMFKQSMILFIELIAHSKEAITRLGCACLRHMILSVGPLLNEELWMVACLTIHKACVLSLHPLMQLMAAFYPCSQSFYGDLAQVKVAARKDSTAEENYRIKQLSQQIFLLENQYDEFKQSDCEIDEERSYILLLCPLDGTDNHSVIRIPYRNIVIGLLANQLILQTIATLLIQGTPRIVPSLANVLLQTPAAITPTAMAKSIVTKTTNDKNEPKLYGLTSFMSQSHINVLFSCLDFSYEKAISFDSRPGLKFLLQKVAGLEKATNLYKQAGACWTLKIIALFELYLYESQKYQVTLDKVKDHMEKFDLKYESSNEFSLNHLLSHQYEPFVVYIFCLRQSFDRLCEKYVDVVLDKDGMYSVIDSVCDQPIFFLISQTEDFPELNRAARFASNLDSASISEIDNGDPGSTVSSQMKSMTVDGSPNPAGAEDIDTESTKKKPFTFSDFISLTSESNDGSESVGGGDTGTHGKDDIQEDHGPSVTEIDKSGLDDDVESVYMMASSRSIDSVVEEYVKRKKSCTMLPTSSHLPKRKQSFGGYTNNVGVMEPLPPEIEQQRKSSINKDSEAHLAVWAEVLISVFDILAQLDDEVFRILLPVLFNGVRSLTAHATHPSLKHALAEFFHRVAVVYGFSP